MDATESVHVSQALHNVKCIYSVRSFSSLLPKINARISVCRQYDSTVECCFHNSDSVLLIISLCHLIMHFNILFEAQNQRSYIC